jgi:hypothetical protein
VQEGVKKGMKGVWGTKQFNVYGVNFAVPADGVWTYSAMELDPDLDKKDPLLVAANEAGLDPMYHYGFTDDTTFAGTETEGEYFDVAPNDPMNAENHGTDVTVPYTYPDPPAPAPESWTNGETTADMAYDTETVEMAEPDDYHPPMRALSYDAFLSGTAERWS